MMKTNNKFSVRMDLSIMPKDIINCIGRHLIISLLVFSWNIHFYPGLSTFLPGNRKCSIFLYFGLFFSRNFLLAPDFGL